MDLSNQARKQLQQLMSDARWQSVDVALQEYLKENFLQESIKRDTEFETLWYAASQEGAKGHLQRFFAEIENEAYKAV